MCSGSSSRRSWPIDRLRRPTRTTPSWSSTGTPSLVSQTSLSSPVAPSRRPSAKASRVFSRAWARAPRWANAIGRSRSDGSRCCTSADDGRPVDCPRVQPVGERDHRDPAAGARRARTGEAAGGAAAGRAHVRRAEEDGQQLPDRDAQRPRRADEGDARHGRPAAQGGRRHRRDGDHRHASRRSRARRSSTSRCPRSRRRRPSWTWRRPIRSPTPATNTPAMDDEVAAAAEPPAADEPTGTPPTPARAAPASADADGGAEHRRRADQPDAQR